MFVTKVSEEKFNLFVEKFRHSTIHQSIEWGKFKSKYNWSMELIGLENDRNELEAAAMLLKKKIPVINKYIIYAPRGFILDYTNKNILKKFTVELKKYAKKTKAVFITLDPTIKLKQRDLDGNIVEGGEDNSWLINELKNIGYLYKGSDKNHKGIQPKFVFLLDITKNLDELIKSFHHKTRYNIKLAEKRGIEVVQGTKDDLKEFDRLMKITSERNQFISRSLDYFENMYKQLEPKDKLKLFIVKYNIKKDLTSREQELEVALNAKKKDDNKIKSLEKKISELENLVNKHNDNIIVSAALLTIRGHHACYLYGASDNLYRNLMPTYLMQWEMIKYAKDKGCTIYDFGGISGGLDVNNPMHGVYKFKKGFNGEFVEYIGEFQLVVHKTYYFLYNNIFTNFNKLRVKVKKILLQR